ncbi:MAG TPA: hypothetical protein VKE88_00195 [Candidatus Nanoarchaeia archaeon]|nr:hypothetical protein [Candidatus Nanoarchaeia archaeon]
MQKMDQELPDFSEGIESHVVFDNVTIPEHTSNAEYNLATLAWRSLIPEGLTVKGIIPHTTKDGRIIAESLLSTSHDLCEYDPARKRLRVLRYSCDSTMNGRKSVDSLMQELGALPTLRTEFPVIVDETLARSRGQKIYTSVDEALKDVHIHPEARHYATAVFFGVPKRRIDEDKLESIFTSCLTPDERKPITELVHRFNEEGYTYLSSSESIFGGGHSFTKLNSLANSLMGNGKDVAGVLRSFENELKSKGLSLEVRF